MMLYEKSLQLRNEKCAFKKFCKTAAVLSLTDLLV